MANTETLISLKQKQLAEVENNIKEIDQHLTKVREDQTETNGLMKSLKKETRNLFIYSAGPLAAAIAFLIPAIVSTPPVQIVLAILSAVEFCFTGVNIAFAIDALKDFKSLAKVGKVDKQISFGGYIKFQELKEELLKQKSDLENEINELTAKLVVDRANKIPTRLLQAGAETQEKKPADAKPSEEEDEWGTTGLCVE